MLGYIPVTAELSGSVCLLM